MKLLNFAERSRKGWHLSRLAQDIARRAKQTVWQRAMPQLTFMTLAEARGYLRARAGEPVRAHMAEIVARYSDSEAAMIDEITVAAIEEVVHQIVRELYKSGQMKAA